MALSWLAPSSTLTLRQQRLTEQHARGNPIRFDGLAHERIQHAIDSDTAL